MIIVREAQVTDQVGLAQVETRVGTELRGIGGPGFPRSAGKGMRRKLAAVLEGEVVGTLVCRQHGRKAVIEKLGVLPEYRRRGVARRLIEFLEEILTSEGVTKLIVRPTADPGCIAFFATLGFTRSASPRRPGKPPRMEKRISALRR